MSRHPVSRREAAAGGVAMLVLAAAAAGQAKAEELDGELLTLVREFKDRETEFPRLTQIEERYGPRSPRGRAADREMRRLVERRWDIRWRVAELTARTPEGLRAKAWLALWETCDGTPEHGRPSCDDQAVAWSLARDLLGRA